MSGRELVQIDKAQLTTLRRVLTATMLTVAISISSAIFYVYQDLQDDAEQCEDDKERSDANRRLWLSILDRAEGAGTPKEEIDPYRQLVQDELPVVRC